MNGDSEIHADSEAHIEFMENAKSIDAMLNAINWSICWYCPRMQQYFLLILHIAIAQVLIMN